MSRLQNAVSRPRLRLAAAAIFLIAAAMSSGVLATGHAARARRGVKLHSWACGSGRSLWCYVLLSAAAERRDESEVRARNEVLIGESGVLARIAKLEPQTPLSWIVPLADTTESYPPADIVASLRVACMKRGILFYGPEGPVEEAEGFPEPARRAGFGERTYVLDHQVVALPDFTLRYLRTRSQGTRPPYAVFEEFEIARGATRKIVVRTDAGFGAWTPTYFDFAGADYVLEGGLSDVLRTPVTHGDVYAWTAAEYRERVRRRYGS